MIGKSSCWGRPIAALLGHGLPVHSTSCVSLSGAEGSTEHEVVGDDQQISFQHG